MENEFNMGDEIIIIEGKYSSQIGIVVEVMYGNDVGLYKSDEKFLYKVEMGNGKILLLWESEISNVDPEKIKERNLIRESMISIDPYGEENW